MLGDPIAGDGVVHHVKCPLLIARIMIQIRPWRRRWVRGILVEVNFGVADWQVHELGREPRHTQQKPEQQFPDEYQWVRQSAGRTLDPLRTQFSTCENVSLRRPGFSFCLRDARVTDAIFRPISPPPRAGTFFFDGTSCELEIRLSRTERVVQFSVTFRLFVSLVSRPSWNFSLRSRMFLGIEEFIKCST